jgi:hypothetical protein
MAAAQGAAVQAVVVTVNVDRLQSDYAYDASLLKQTRSMLTK